MNIVLTNIQPIPRSISVTRNGTISLLKYKLFRLLPADYSQTCGYRFTSEEQHKSALIQPGQVPPTQMEKPFIYIYKVEIKHMMN